MTDIIGAGPVDVVRRHLAGSERIAVTGATGWFGRTALEVLYRSLGSAAFRARVTAYASTTKAVTVGDDIEVRAEPLERLVQRSDLTHLLHFAFLTRDKASTRGTADYVAANLGISDIVLEALGRRGLAGFAYTSSGAARAAPGSGARSLHDNPYGALKRIDELAFRQACTDAGTVSCIARVFSVSGPYMSDPSLYALGDFVTRATRGEPLEVRARGKVLRSYTAVADVVAVQLATILRPGSPDTVFETGGEVVEVGELAERVDRVVRGGNAGVVRSDTSAGVPGDRYVGDEAKMQALARAIGLRLASLDEQIAATAAWLSHAEARPASPR